MSPPYRIFGLELSPYSVKVRSYFRYKDIPHQWIVRSAATMDEFQRFAKLPLIPLVVTPEGEALQDSTPIIERMEERHPDPALQPSDPALAFVSALLEEYADEWGNKPMFHFRWTYEPDQESAAERIARANLPGASEGAIRKAIDAITQRMIPRLALVGSNEATADQIEGSFERQLALLERHLATRPYVFGGRPALADLGLFAQLHQCASDPTPGERMLKVAPRVLAWIERMLEPRALGEFEAWDALASTLEPLLTQEVAGLYFPWAEANARALGAGEKRFEVELEGRPFVQDVQKYHARSLAALRARYAATRHDGALDAILARTGCLSPLRA